MKILMITDRLALGGAETHLYELIRALQARGETVEIASAGGPYVARIQRAGILHHTVPFDDRRPRGLFRAKKALSALLRDGGYDILHAHARLPAFLADPVCRRAGVPLVTTAHWTFDTRAWKKRFSRWGDHTLAVSPDIRLYLQRAYGLSPERIKETRNGIDTLYFSPPPTSEAQGRLVHVSRLAHGRAHMAGMLISLAPQLVAAGAKSLTVVGDGEEFPSLLARAEAVNRSLGRPFIRMIGGTEEVLPYLQEADIFIGVSRAALEAMACALPVILGGDEGYLSVFDPGAAEAAEDSNFCCRGGARLREENLLADITRLLEDPTASAARGRQNRAYVQKNYSTAAMAEDALAVYEAVRRKRAHPLPIILCGYYGFDNLGDEAGLAWLLSTLRRDGYKDITVLTARREETEKKYKVRTASRLSLSAILQAGRKQGVFLLGGGNLLQDGTSRRSLLYYTACMHYAHACGCRIFVMGGVGPLSRGGRKSVCAVLKRAEVCFARTPQDKAAFTALGAKEVILLPDGVLWAKPACLPPAIPRGKLLLLALRGGGDEKTDRTLTDACACLSRYGGYTVAIARMYPAQDEEAACAAVRRIPDAYLLPPLSAGEMLSLLQKQCHLVFATRLHALILAAAAGVPAIAPHDGGKIDAFAAFVARCDPGGDTPMLACPAPLNKQNCMAAGQGALEKRPDKERQDRFLANLKRAGENFSFTRFL